jgi:hypothetical protein
MGEIIDFEKARQIRTQEFAIQPVIAAEDRRTGTEDEINEDEYSDRWFAFMTIYWNIHPELFPHHTAYENNLALLDRRYNGILMDITDEEQVFAEELAEKQSEEMDAFEKVLLAGVIARKEAGILKISENSLEKLNSGNRAIPPEDQELIFRDLYYRYLPEVITHD